MSWSWLESWSRLQLVPAVGGGIATLGVLIVLVGSVICFGRIYCSVICPLGILQWLFRYVVTLTPFRKVAKRPLPRPLLVSTKTLWAIRLGFLALFLASFSFGIAAWLAPYGIFGRTAMAFFGDVEFPLPAKALIGAQMAFILLATLWRSRFWCNTVCPVGTLLGLFSRFAIARVRIDKSKCVNCNLCVRACQNGCISPDKDKTVDHSRCVTCFGCARVCKKGALTWR